MLTAGTPTNGKIASKSARLGHIVFATAGSTIAVELTQAGSAKGLDTTLTVHGPRTPFGYASVVASDDDSGHGPLSRIRDLEIEQDGFYLVEVAIAADSPEIANKAYRLSLTCTGNCTATGPVAPIGLDIRWALLSAEYRAASLQAFALATARIEALHAAGSLSDQWAISTDAATRTRALARSRAAPRRPSMRPPTSCCSSATTSRTSPSDQPVRPSKSNYGRMFSKITLSASERARSRSSSVRTVHASRPTPSLRAAVVAQNGRQRRS